MLRGCLPVDELFEEGEGFGVVWRLGGEGLGLHADDDEIPGGEDVSAVRQKSSCGAGVGRGRAGARAGFGLEDNSERRRAVSSVIQLRWGGRLLHSLSKEASVSHASAVRPSRCCA